MKIESSYLMFCSWIYSLSDNDHTWIKEIHACYEYQSCFLGTSISVLNHVGIFFLDHELNDLFIDTREAAIVYVGEKSSVNTQISSYRRPIIAFLAIDIDQTKWLKWLLNILCIIRQTLHVYIWLHAALWLVLMTSNFMYDK